MWIMIFKISKKILLLEEVVGFCLLLFELFFKSFILIKWYILCYYSKKKFLWIVFILIVIFCWKNLRENREILFFDFLSVIELVIMNRGIWFIIMFYYRRKIMNLVFFEELKVCGLVY